MKFILSKKMKPKGDQPQAIEKLVKGIKSGQKHQTLLGVTGSGKTFTIANVIEKIQKPTLVIAHNKTLAAQLCSEFREFFPNNAVGYFVSYYDYYQPEAYLPNSDTYIEKDAAINEEIDRLRHFATTELLSRNDVIIVASVSCIYGLGSPEEYKKSLIKLTVGEYLTRYELIEKLISLYYERNSSFVRGTFRSHGQTVEIIPPDKDLIYRIEFNYDKIEQIVVFDKLTRKRLNGHSGCYSERSEAESKNLFRKGIPRQARNDSIKDIDESLFIFPAKHFVVGSGLLKRAIQQINDEMEERIKYFQSQGKIVEAERIERRTRYDMELLHELGYCKGVENYSRYLTSRMPGETPYTLIDYFPTCAKASVGKPHLRQGSDGQAPDFLTVIDESHVSVPQIGGMYEGDKSRKNMLIDYGFRLPSAYDNRPLKFLEFEKKVGQTIYTSATPGKYELHKSCPNPSTPRGCTWVVEQIIRPTGLVDPETIVKPIENQVDDVMNEIEIETKKGNRVLVTTLTKKMAEDLAKFLEDRKVRAKYLHSDVDTLDRIRILKDLRLGKFDVLVGVNLLREGLDLPEVSLVAILDADKEGFLRSETSLVQTIGRAARNVFGRVILYADEITGSMKRALNETNRRRKIQQDYNNKHGITPQTIIKEIKSIIADEIKPKLPEEFTYLTDVADIPKLIRQKEQEMSQYAKTLKFEEAALIRDEIKTLKKLQIK